MNEKKFYLPALIVSILAAGLSFFLFSVEGIVAGIIGLVLSIIKRKTHLTKLSTVLSILAILGGLTMIAFWSYFFLRGGNPTEYWLFRLLFPDNYRID